MAPHASSSHSPGNASQEAAKNSRAEPSRSPRSTSRACDRILEAADELFSRQGIRAVGIDTIVESSDVARMTLYRHFAS